MFRRIRIHLTLWYSGVLTVAIIVLGIALYLGVRQAMLSPVDNALHRHASEMALLWQQVPEAICPLSLLDTGHSFRGCYSSDGRFIGASGFAAGIPAFNDRNLISSALHSGSATATIAGPSPFGQLRLYAQRVSDPRGGILGVVEAGQPVGDRLAALNTLALLLLILGPLALIIAAAGGLILANRALAPARMSYLRQRNFIADASHELRTPLTMLRADAEVLLRRRAMLESEDAALLDDMVAETSHMTSLANSMLRLARLDSTDEPLEQDVCDLAGLAATIVHRIAPLAEEHGIAVHLATGGPQSLIIGDQQLLEQAVLVLVDNAVKYNHPGGEVMIRTENHGELVILTVHDTGIGMTPEDLAHLGERFYRVDKARSREGGGAGLGVSIARSIILRHRGSLEFQSEAGKSTSARVSLPAAAAPSNGGKA